ncbi:MAG TPA: SpoIIIAH-like family protein [Bacillota bacterium]
MMERFLETLRHDKLWLGVGCLLFLGLFWFGYRQIIRVNQPAQTPQIQEQAPPKIPREYNPSDSLLDLKIERDRERSQQVEQVRELLEKVGLSDDIRKQAEQELWRLTQATVKEQELETLLEAKGFKDVLVTISRGLVTIVINGKLDPELVRQIGQVTMDVTAFDLDQVEIVEH